MAMDRRQFMLGSGLGLLATAMPGFPVLANTAAPGRRRLVTVMLYGGMDGLAAVTPYGDIAMAQARRGTTIPRPGRGPGAGLDLDGFFSLHPAMAALKPHYDRGHLAIVHATGRSRSNGSHFLCQDEVQIGMQHQPNFRTDGWLNRAWGVLEGDRPILSMTRRVPLIARGSAPSVSYSKSSLPDVSAQDYARVASLYESNPKFQAAFREAGVAREIARKALAEARAKSRGKKSEFFASAALAGRILASPYGPSVCCLEMRGWDHHSAQGGSTGLFANYARDLATGLDALVEGLGPAFEQTVILVFSEFGRTVLENGSKGTDHGWGGVFFVLGGGVNGGKVYGRWPGLVSGATFAKKQLDVTTNQFAVFAEVMRDHLSVDEAYLADDVFPTDRWRSPNLGLLRT